MKEYEEKLKKYNIHITERQKKFNTYFEENISSEFKKARKLMEENKDILDNILFDSEKKVANF